MVVSTQDYFAHHKCLDHVVKYYKSKMMTGLTRVRLYTDGCPAQYACRQNFCKVADFPQRHDGLLLEHVVAIRYCFKGTHDGAGKLSTHFCQNAEKAGVIVDAETGEQRIFAARTPFRMFYECWLGLKKPKKDWTENPNKPLNAFDRYFWRYMTYDADAEYGDDQSLFDAAKSRGDVLVHDRVTEDWDATAPEGSKKYHVWFNGMAEKTINPKDLRCRDFACGCTACRPPNFDYENCRYSDVGNLEKRPVEFRRPAGRADDDGVQRRQRGQGAVEAAAAEDFAARRMNERAKEFGQRLGEYVAFGAGRKSYWLGRLHNIYQMKETKRLKNDMVVRKDDWVCDVNWLNVVEKATHTYRPGDPDKVPLQSLVPTPEKLVLEPCSIMVKSAPQKRKKDLKVDALRLSEASHCAIMAQPLEEYQ